MTMAPGRRTAARSRAQALADSADEEEERYNESFADVGTPFPDLEPQLDQYGNLRQPKDEGKFVPVWKQEAKRFHGAFTGGFSAGYYNTVGSKEGWTPSSFVSSRTTRAASRTARAEDFMDEEDLAEYAAANPIVTAEEFDTLGFTARVLEQKRAIAGTMAKDSSALGGIPDRFLDELVVASEDPIGIRLLKKMGWREGQGVGPRTAHARKRRKFTDKAPDESGQAEAIEEASEDIIDPYARGILFAPKDAVVTAYAEKANRMGLGHDPFRGANEFRLVKEGSKAAAEKKEARNRLSFAGFGSDEEEDQDCVYRGMSSSRSNLASSLVEEEQHTFVLGARRFAKSRRTETSRSAANLGTARKHCNDGREPLRGFVLSVKPAKFGKWFKPPMPPEGYRPIIRFIEAGPATLKTPQAQSNQAQRGSALLLAKADERGRLLGEEQLDAPRRSVFDYINLRDRTRIQAISEPNSQDAGAPVPQSQKKPVFPVPSLEASVAAAALKSYPPVPPEKQQRYRRFLEVKAGLVVDETRRKSEEELIMGSDYPGSDADVSEETRQEWAEFAACAVCFRPMSSIMASRFTSAGSTAVQKEFAQPEGGLRAGAAARPDGHGAVANAVDRMAQERVEQKAREAEEAAARAEAVDDETAMLKKAVSMKMFGPVTRKTSSFVPSRLLCKRFNVPMPVAEPASELSGSATPSSRDGDRRPDGRRLKETLSHRAVQEMLEVSMRERNLHSFVRPATASAPSPRTSANAGDVNAKR